MLLQRLALALAAGAGLAAGPVRAATATATYDLDAGGSGTFFAGDVFTSWLAKGTLPVGSILRSVSVNATLTSTNNSNWAWDLMVMVDPTPLTPGGDAMLAIGNGDSMGPTWNLTWAGSGAGGVGTTVSDTKRAPANFPATIDLHNAELLIGNSWDGAGVGGTWSGTVTVTYDTLDLATITTFGLPGNPAVITGTNIAWTVPNGTDVTALKPTYTLTSGTCTKASGSTQNFSTPQTYSVTDGTFTRVYTVTVVVDAPFMALQVNLDTATRTGLVGPAGGAGATWNQRLGTAGLTAGGLLSASGAATPAGFTCNAGNVDAWGDPALKMLAGGVYQTDWNTPSSLVISSLSRSRKYALFLASFHPNQLGGRSLFSTTNITTTAGTQIADNLGPGGNTNTWVRGVNYVRFDSVEPDSAGRITITMTGDSGINERRAYLNGFQLLDAAPPVPAGLAATPGDAQVALGWSASAGASGYTVKRSLTSGTGYASIGTVSEPGFTDLTAVFGTTYYYVVSANNVLGVSANCAQVGSTPAASPAKDILTFGPGALISGSNIFWALPSGTVLTNLAPTFAVSAKATCSPASATSRNFSSPQTYTVTAQNGSTQVYTVTATVAVAANQISGFTFPGLGNATISGTRITLSVPSGTPVTALAPSFVLSAGATCVPASGTPRDFTNPQTYTVTAKNGTVWVYTVAVQPTVTLGLSGSPLPEAGGVATVTATLSAAHWKDVTVYLAFSGTATLTNDYRPAATSIVIPAGQTLASTTLTAVPNTVYSSVAKTIVVVIASVTNGTLSDPQQVTAAIAEDDAQPPFPIAAGQRGIVTCRENPAITYDIYLPTNYSADGPPLPILYTCNPSGGGMVDDFLTVCASLQIITVGLMNSRNGDTWDPFHLDVFAVTRDIRQRVLYDPTAEMAAGFSGGGQACYGFARARGQHVAGIFPMGGWMGVSNYAYTAQDRVPSGLLVARSTGTSDGGAISYAPGDKSFLLSSCGALVQDWSFAGGHSVAPDDVKTPALTWILSNRTLAGTNERAAALAQALGWRARIGAGERQAVLGEAVNVLMGSCRTWYAYQAQLILDQLMDDVSFGSLDVANLAHGNSAREQFYDVARGAALNGDWQNYRAAMKALTGVIGADGYRSSDIYALLGLYGYPAPVLTISHAEGQLGFSLGKDTLGLIYTLQSSPDLSSGSWQDVSCTVAQTATTWSAAVGVPSEAKKGFYRIFTISSAGAVP